MECSIIDAFVNGLDALVTADDIMHSHLANASIGFTQDYLDEVYNMQIMEEPMTCTSSHIVSRK